MSGYTSNGVLTMTNGDLTVGCTRANANFEIGSGTFDMQGGTLMVNGRLRKLELPDRSVYSIRGRNHRRWE
jgi:hypothetical protein